MTRAEAIEILRVSQNSTVEEILRAASDRESELGEASSPEQARTLEDRRRRILAAKSLLRHDLPVIHAEPEGKVQPSEERVMFGEPVPVVRRKTSRGMIMAAIVGILSIVGLAGWVMSLRSQLDYAASAYSRTYDDLEKTAERYAQLESELEATRAKLSQVEADLAASGAEVSKLRSADHTFSYLTRDIGPLSTEACMMRAMSSLQEIAEKVPSRTISGGKPGNAWSVAIDQGHIVIACVQSAIGTTSRLLMFQAGTQSRRRGDLYDRLLESVRLSW